MKPNEVPIEAGEPKHVQSQAPPRLRSQLMTGIKLFTIAGVILAALWLVDRIVTS